MRKKKIDKLDLKIRFNNYFIRETNMFVNENDYLCVELDGGIAEILQTGEKFLKVSEDEYPIIEFNEIDVNLIENPKLTELLCYIWIKNNINNTIISLNQVEITGSNKGQCILSYLKNDNMTAEIKSDAFENESVRIFNLICKILNREHLYDFNSLDVKIERDK